MVELNALLGHIPNVPVIHLNTVDIKEEQENNLNYNPHTAMSGLQ